MPGILRRKEDKIDLIVTDMQYPLEAGEAVDKEARFKLIGGAG